MNEVGVQAPVGAETVPGATERGAVVRIPPAAGDRMAPACAAVVWAAARKMAAELDASTGRSALPTGAWDAFLGRWADPEAGGGVGGVVTFSAALDGRMLVRRGAVMPSGGAGHEDLMLITPEADGSGADCMYQDSEGHVIQYAATWTDDGRGLELASVPSEDSPRYRQSWRLADADTLHVSFEFAPAGGAELAQYSQGALRRVSSQS